MDATVAETVARATRDQAVNDAHDDLQKLRRHAVEAGRERSRKITKTSRIDPRSGEIRYNPAGRLVRDWYVHVYLNTLRSKLGEPAEVIDAQQVEDTTKQLHLMRPAVSGVGTIQAVAVIRDVAISDAARAASQIVDILRSVGARRAIQHAPDDRFDGDRLRVHVTRHWYLRCYQDHVEHVTGSQQPLTAITYGEQAQVAVVLETRVPRRIIDRHGVPLMTAHGTATTDIDRRLAAGETHVVSGVTDPKHRINPQTTLRHQVTRAWADLDVALREHWIRAAGAEIPIRGLAWSDLGGESKSKIIMLYLRTCVPDRAEAPFHEPPIKQTAETAARRMFNHRDQLDSGSVLLEAQGSSEVPAGDPYRAEVRSADRSVRSSPRSQP